MDGHLAGESGTLPCLAMMASLLITDQTIFSITILLIVLQSVVNLFTNGVYTATTFKTIDNL